MKIFVTGGTGFIGSNFIINQVNNNKILNYDKLTYAANENNLKELVNNPSYNFIKGDITDRKSLINCINNFKPDSVINFAAESHVDRSIDGADEFINTNIFGTYQLLEASLTYYKSLSSNNNKNFKFLHVSTDEVFGSLEKKGFFTEQTPYNPSSPYSASKASSDHLVNAWFKTYDLPILITNCSNNYGPYQFPEKLIPLMIINCLNNNKLPIYGKGDNIRDWLYVKDHCEALSIVLNRGVIGETYNIGGNEEKSNLQIVNMIIDILDNIYPKSDCSSYKELIAYVKDRPGHDYRYAIDASKIKNELGWEPKNNLKSALENTINWYINNKPWWEEVIKKKYNLKRLGAL